MTALGSLDCAVCQSLCYVKFDLTAAAACWIGNVKCLLKFTFHIFRFSYLTDFLPAEGFSCHTVPFPWVAWCLFFLVFKGIPQKMARCMLSKSARTGLFLWVLAFSANNYRGCLIAAVRSTLNTVPTTKLSALTISRCQIGQCPICPHIKPAFTNIFHNPSLYWGC